ncbi:CBS domain-containing protein [Streptomyces neyagawaensis]|uniref:CBS domain-containing protein n=1 Tax=Streptomyces neyagawaensis TaxID=42238 RepID=UPI0035588712
MAQRHVERLPVVDEEDRLVGIVTRRVCSRPSCGRTGTSARRSSTRCWGGRCGRRPGAPTSAWSRCSRGTAGRMPPSRSR